MRRVTAFLQIAFLISMIGCGGGLQDSFLSGETKEYCRMRAEGCAFPPWPSIAGRRGMMFDAKMGCWRCRYVDKKWHFRWDEDKKGWILLDD